MLRLPVEVKDSPFQLYVKPCLAEFSRTLIVSFMSLIKQILFLHYCFAATCSDMQSFHLEDHQLRQIFKCNRYPIALADQCVKTFLNKIFVPKRTLITFPKKDILIVPPFLGQYSLNLKSRLYNC